MMVKVNYSDKSRSNIGIPKDEMPYQGCDGEVVAVGRGIKNALVEFRRVFLFRGMTVKTNFVYYAVIPRGNLNYL